jgi:hypothetical protein
MTASEETSGAGVTDDETLRIREQAGRPLRILVDVSGGLLVIGLTLAGGALVSDDGTSGPIYPWFCVAHVVSAASRLLIRRPQICHLVDVLAASALLLVEHRVDHLAAPDDRMWLRVLAGSCAHACRLAALLLLSSAVLAGWRSVRRRSAHRRTTALPGLVVGAVSAAGYLVATQGGFAVAIDADIGLLLVALVLGPVLLRVIADPMFVAGMLVVAVFLLQCAVACRTSSDVASPYGHIVLAVLVMVVPAAITTIRSYADGSYRVARSLTVWIVLAPIVLTGHLHVSTLRTLERLTSSCAWQRDCGACQRIGLRITCGDIEI